MKLSPDNKKLLFLIGVVALLWLFRAATTTHSDTYLAVPEEKLNYGPVSLTNFYPVLRPESGQRGAYLK